MISGRVGSRSLMRSPRRGTGIGQAGPSGGAANRPPCARCLVRPQVRPGVRQIVDAMTEAPAFVRNGWLEILYANRLAAALFSQAFDGQGRTELALNFEATDLPRTRA
jgi:hypothetical protein